MRRTVIVAAFAGVGFLVVRALRVHERLMAGCERMFERAPDTFPPKRMLRGIEEVRRDTARILAVLEAGKEETAEPEAHEASAVGTVHHVA